MAFPTTGLLDDFNRSDEDLDASANWTADSKGFGSGDMSVESNQVRADVDGNEASYWSAETFGPNSTGVEVHVTIATKGADDEIVTLDMLTATGSGWDGYMLRFETFDAATDTWEIWEHDGGWRKLGATVTQELDAGEKIGFEWIDSDLVGYHFDGSSWSSVISRSDSEHSGSPNIGLTIQSTTYRLDDFSGGTVAAGGAAAHVPSGLALLGVGS